MRAYSRGHRYGRTRTYGPIADVGICGREFEQQRLPFLPGVRLGPTRVQCHHLDEVTYSGRHLAATVIGVLRYRWGKFSLRMQLCTMLDARDNFKVACSNLQKYSGPP